MSINNMLIAILREAETYNHHGLLDEARLKYQKAMEIIQANKQLPNRKALIQIIQSKVASLKSDTDLNGGQAEPIDIISIEIALDVGPGKGHVLEFDVDFQAGNILSIIIPRKNESLMAQLQELVFLNDILFYSPISIFKGAGEVNSCIEIKNGPKKGNYCIKIRIVD